MYGPAVRCKKISCVAGERPSPQSSPYLSWHSRSAASPRPSPARTAPGGREDPLGPVGAEGSPLCTQYPDANLCMIAQLRQLRALIWGQFKRRRRGRCRTGRPSAACFGLVRPTSLRQGSVFLCYGCSRGKKFKSVSGLTAIAASRRVARQPPLRRRWAAPRIGVGKRRNQSNRTTALPRRTP
jgi:hypothetical protein